MGVSRRWKLLKLQIDNLRKQFLPNPFNPLGQYPNGRRVQAYTRAFLVLSHAEIETYLEDWAKDLARASEKAWTSPRKRVTMPMAFLLTSVAKRIEIPRTLSGPGSKDCPRQLAEVSVKLFQEFYRRVNDNNGIKERNVLTLFGPLGVPASALGSTLLPNLDNFGALRGIHAHHSAKAVPSVLDPDVEYRRVTALVDEIGPLDEWLVLYKRRIR